MSLRVLKHTCDYSHDLNYTKILDENSKEDLPTPLTDLRSIIFADDFVSMVLIVDMYKFEVSYIDEDMLCYMCHMPALQTENGTVYCDYCYKPVCGDCSFIVPEGELDPGARCCIDSHCVGTDAMASQIAFDEVQDIRHGRTDVTVPDYLPLQGNPAIYNPHNEEDMEQRHFNMQQQFIEDRNNTSSWGYYSLPE